MPAETAELSGTVKKMSPSGKGFLLNEYENWWNFGIRYDGPRPFRPDAAITITYEENIRVDGTSSFFVLSAWPTTGQAGPVPPQVTPAGLTPTAPIGPPTPLPPLPEPMAPSGSTPTPPNRENYILYEVAMKEAREFINQMEPENSPQRTLGHWLFLADTMYLNALQVIGGDSRSLLPWAKSFIALEEGDGDPGPEEPA